MDKFTINPKGEFPLINFDPNDREFVISGVSLPEDAKEFYKPVLNWWENMDSSLFSNELLFDFKMEYYNTSTFKCFLDLFEVFDKLKDKGANIQVNWYFVKGDIDMMKAGKDFNDLFDVPVETIEFEGTDEEDYY